MPGTTDLETSPKETGEHAQIEVPQEDLRRRDSSCVRCYACM
jgi:hypothetical protein